MHFKPALLLICLAGSASGQIAVYQIQGSAAGDGLGKPMVRIGDLNADGTDDLLIGSPRDDTAGPNVGSVRAVSGLDGSEIYRVDGSSQSELFGSALARIGDVDGDSIDDWVVGAPFASLNGPRDGRVELRSGVNGALIRSIVGIEQYSNLGTAVAGIGDVNGDQVPDFIVSAPFADSNGADAGGVHVYSGLTGSMIRYHFGAAASDNLGIAVLACGDQDGDSVEDYAMGSLQAGPGLGRVDVYSGASGLLVGSIQGTALTGPIGNTIASLADMNGDGRRELAIGAVMDSTSGSVTGAAYVYSIQSGQLLQSVFGESGQTMGHAVADAGDWNGDGSDDWLVGCTGPTPLGGYRLYSGLDGTLLSSQLPLAHLGLRGLAFAGGFDLNGDGRSEFALGDSFADVSGTDSGAVVMLGGGSLLGDVLCAGDGASGQPCPCGNLSVSGSGCLHTGGFGAILSATGSASVALDDLQFFLSDSAAHKPALLLAAAQSANGGLGSFFGDGLRCTSGATQKLAVRFADHLGNASWGPGILNAQGWGAGQSQVFQVLFRDGSSSPCGTAINLTNGLGLQLLP